jgi:hypothetical protein
MYGLENGRRKRDGMGWDEMDVTETVLVRILITNSDLS